MSKQFNLRLFPYLITCDLLLTLASLALARLARLYWPFGATLDTPLAAHLPRAVFGLVALIWLFCFILFQVYAPKHTGRLPQELGAVSTATLTATAVLAGILYLSFREVPRLLFVYFLCFDLAFLILFRVALRWFLQFQAGGQTRPERVLIVGAGKVGAEMAERISHFRGWFDVEVVGFVDDDGDKQGQAVAGKPVLGTLDNVGQIVADQSVDQVIFTLPLRAYNRLINLAVELQKLPVDVKVVPDLFDIAFARTRADDFMGFPVIGLRESAISDYEKMVKRLFDIIAASLLLLLALPVMLIAALVIALDSRGPVLFKQRRVGENGRLFWMYKFRSMVQDADTQLPDIVRSNGNGEAAYKSPNDPRVTGVGRVLRRSSLDELPQLLNVLRGEMSLVGPRPELPWLVEQYQPWQRKRLTVPPGITGWWQVRGRSNHPMHLSVDDDLYYIAHYSLKLDLVILFRTIRAVITGDGAY